MAKTKVHGEYLDPSVISGQTQVTAVGADSVLIFDATDNALKKALLSDVIETIDGGAPTFTAATISASNPVLNIVRTSNYSYKIGSLANDTFVIQSNETTDASFAPLIEIDSFAHQGGVFLKGDANGRLGIRQTSPDTTVHIGDGASHFVRIENASSGDVSSGYQIYRGASTVGAQLYDNPADNATTLLTAGKFNIITGGSGIDFHIDSSGNVGLGITSPTSVLHVAADSAIITLKDTNGSGNAATPYVLFEDSGGTNLGYVGFGSGGNSTMFVTNYADADLEFLTNSSTRMTIDNSGNVGIGDSNPQHPLKVHLTNGEIAMFGSNGMNSPGNYAGIGLGQVLANNTTYQKVSLVTEGRNSGSYIQDFHILVDTAADSGSAVLADKKFTIDGGTGAVVMPSQPVAIYAHSTNSEAGAYNYTWSGTGAQTITMKPQQSVVNRGNMYNTSNGRFTAPVDGIYRYAVHGNLYTSGLTASSYFLVRILKSGNHYVYHYEDNGTNAANGWLYKNYAGLISLTAGQYIEMQLTGQNLSSTQGFGWDLASYTHYEFQLLY